MCIGGPALIYYVTPTEEQLFLVCPSGLLLGAHTTWITD